MTSSKVIEKPHLNCKDRGPGPSYDLPSTIGYDKHDPSRYRSPAYTITARHGRDELTFGPGPMYDIYHLTNRGRVNTPAFSISKRPKFTVQEFGPGPCAYEPEKCPPMNHRHRQPAFSIVARRKDIYLSQETPGPNAYFVPSCLGPKIPDKKASSAFTITRRWDDKNSKDIGPGPGDYGNPDFYLVKKRHPAFSMRSRHKQFDNSYVPGPIYNPSDVTRKSSPKFSFGLRHSECVTTPLLPDDNDD